MKFPKRSFNNDCKENFSEKVEKNFGDSKLMRNFARFFGASETEAIRTSTLKDLQQTLRVVQELNEASQSILENPSQDFPEQPLGCEKRGFSDNYHLLEIKETR